MKKAYTKDGRLARLMKICLALPEAIQESAGRHATFLVRKDTFAYYLNDHHGDGIISVCCKVLPGDNEALVAAQPAKFYMPAYIGPRGWVALRLDVSGLDWNEVAELVVGSYKLIAPKRLALLANSDRAKAAAVTSASRAPARARAPARQPEKMSLAGCAPGPSRSKRAIRLRVAYDVSDGHRRHIDGRDRAPDSAGGQAGSRHFVRVRARGSDDPPSDLHLLGGGPPPPTPPPGEA